MPSHSFTHQHRSIPNYPVEATTFIPGDKYKWWVTAGIETGQIIDEGSHLIIVGQEPFCMPTDMIYADDEGNVASKPSAEFHEHYEAITI